MDIISRKKNKDNEAENSRITFHSNSETIKRQNSFPSSLIYGRPICPMIALGFPKFRSPDGGERYFLLFNSRSNFLRLQA